MDWAEPALEECPSKDPWIWNERQILNSPLNPHPTTVWDYVPICQCALSPPPGVRIKGGGRSPRARGLLLQEQEKVQSPRTPLTPNPHILATEVSGAVPFASCDTKVAWESSWIFLCLQGGNRGRERERGKEKEGGSERERGSAPPKNVTIENGMDCAARNQVRMTPPHWKTAWRYAISEHWMGLYIGVDAGKDRLPLTTSRFSSLLLSLSEFKSLTEFRW